MKPKGKPVYPPFKEGTTPPFLRKGEVHVVDVRPKVIKGGVRKPKTWNAGDVLKVK